MPVAKDVATFAAVVPPDKVAEIAFARRVVANGGFGVGLIRAMLAIVCPVDKSLGSNKPSSACAWVAL